MRTPFRLFLLLPPLVCACDAAEDVRVQELPALERSSLEARLGLPEMRGPWRFAGWELREGDSLGLEAELPSFGTLLLQTQKRDSLAGFYLTAGGGRAPLQGEVRRDSVVALVTFPSPGDGRYLVGEVAQDTLWLESSTLAEPGSWRGDARAAFVRGQAVVAPFRRIRGVFAAAPPVDSAALSVGIDSLRPGRVGTTTPPQSAIAGGGVRAGAATGPTAGIRPAPATAGQPTGRSAVRPTTPAPLPRTGAQPPVTQPVTDPTEQPVVEEEEPEPEPTPAVQREPPRILGVPVERDTTDGQLP